jgi:hypothetical protein
MQSDLAGTWLGRRRVEGSGVVEATLFGSKLCEYGRSLKVVAEGLSW